METCNNLMFSSSGLAPFGRMGSFGDDIINYEASKMFDSVGTDQAMDGWGPQQTHKSEDSSIFNDGFISETRISQAQVLLELEEITSDKTA
jgi:hypothetical protein